MAKSLKALAGIVGITLLAAGCANVKDGTDHFRTTTLAENGKADCVIVVDPKAPRITRFAALELKTFLDKALKVDIPLVEALPADKAALVVGDNAWSRQAGVEVAALPRDGYRIKSVGDRIFIAGVDDPLLDPDKDVWLDYHRERATLFGVYEFLERFAGVRFYFPGDIGTVVPKLRELKVPGLDIADSPDYSTRQYSWDSGAWFDDGDAIRGKRLNHWRARMQTDYVPNCHGLSYMDYLRRFGKTHPEYFALLANGKRNNVKDPSVYHQGQLCYTSALKEEIYKDAEAYLTGKPASSRDMPGWNANAAKKGYFNVMPQDGFVKCLCPECRKFSEDDLVWNMTCDIAGRLQRNHIPGYVTQMAYGACRAAPERGIPDNVLVMVAQAGPWNDADAALRDKDDALTAAWVKKLGHKVWLWNYSINESKMTEGLYGIPGAAQMTPRAVGGYYQRQSPWITGAFMESETDQFIMNYLNYYVLGKVFWNNKTDVDALLAEHHRLMFGAGAEPMAKFYDELERIWTRQIRGRTVETSLGPMMVKPTEFDLWESFYSPAKLAEFNGLFDQAEKATAADPDALNRVKFMRRQLLAPILAGSKKYFAELGMLDGWTLPVRTLAPGEKLDTMRGDKVFLRPFKSGVCEVKTVVRAQKDAEKLYLSFDCAEPEAARMKRPERKPNDGDIWLDSCVEIHLNPSGDRKTYYQLIVNAAGSSYQKAAVKAGKEDVQAKPWDSGAEIRTSVGKDRWTADIAIPLKSLGEIQAAGFPVNFIRTRGLEGEPPRTLHYCWSPVVKSGFNELENFGSFDFAPPTAPPLVGDGDFSADSLGPWRVRTDGYHKAAPGSAVELDGATFVKGGRSLRMRSAGGLFAVEQTLRGLKPNTEYRLRFYLKTEQVTPTADSGGAKVQVFGDGIGSRWFPKNGYTGDMDWTKQGFVFTTAPKAGDAGVKLWMSNAVGTAWFDDVAVEEVAGR